MAGIHTVTKFGVPVYSNGGNTPSKIGILQDKYSNRFRVRVVNFGDEQKLEDLSRQVSTVTRPSINHNPVTVDSYNSKAYYQGKHEWQPITLTVRDDITNRVSRIVGQQEQKQINHYEQTAYAAGINYKFNMYIELLDGGNIKTLEEWYIEGCFLESVNWGQLDYSNAEPATIEMVIRMDNCQLAGENGREKLFPIFPYNNMPGTNPGTIA